MSTICIKCFHRNLRPRPPDRQDSGREKSQGLREGGTDKVKIWEQGRAGQDFRHMEATMMMERRKPTSAPPGHTGPVRLCLRRQLLFDMNKLSKQDSQLENNLI